MTTERRIIEPVPGRRVPIDLVVLPDLQSIDWTQPHGPRSPELLERADAALRGWRPSQEQPEQRRDRLRRTRSLRRGEGVHDETLGARRTSDDELERLVAADELAAEHARSGTMPSIEQLRAVHAVLVGRVDPEPWRREVLWFGDRHGPASGVELQPTAPERVPAAMAGLDAALTSPAPPLVKAAVAAAYLPGVHPWHDGNGRMGRIATNWIVAAAYGVDGRGPDVAGRLVEAWDAAMTVRNEWLLRGDLDAWVAAVAGAAAQAAGPFEAPPRKRRFGRRS